MKKFIKILTIALCFTVGLLALSACNNNSEKDIMVISREAGSGTRDAFDGFVKDPSDTAGKATLAKDAAGANRATNIFISTMIEVSTTASVKTLVAGNTNAIGYMSLGSTDATVKVLKYEGIEATKGNVSNGTYKMQRPFLIMTNKNTTLTNAAEDFMSYLHSAEAQTIADTFGCVKQGSGQAAYVSGLTAVGASEKAVIIRGSTSVEPLMKLYIADYIAKNTGKIVSANFDISCAGSGAGQSAVNNNTATDVNKTIGLSSSSYTHDNVVSFTVCLDAVAIVVHKDNADIADITSHQLFKVYTGTTKKFSEIAE